MRSHVIKQEIGLVVHRPVLLKREGGRSRVRDHWRNAHNEVILKDGKDTKG